MPDLSCKYLGLDLKNPIVVGSSGLTSTMASLTAIRDAGAGAVVLKSIFEEQIRFETEKFINSDHPDIQSWQEAFQGIVSKQEYFYEDAFAYLSDYAREHTLKQYLSLIREAKVLDIPIIASINCNSSYDWQFFARRIEEAGADAIELNVYLLPSDFEKTGAEIESLYFEIISQVKSYVSIPVSMKIGYYFSSLANMALKLSESGIAGLTLFNRPYNPDIDIQNLQINSANMFSRDSEYSHTLRWVALLSGKLKCDIAASTGIHSAETVIKQLLAGANVVHMVSVFYKSPFALIREILDAVENWMEKSDFDTITDFRGLLCKNNLQNPAVYERVQFLQLFSAIH